MTKNNSASTGGGSMVKHSVTISSPSITGLIKQRVPTMTNVWEVVDVALKLHDPNVFDIDITYRGCWIAKLQVHDNGFRALGINGWGITGEAKDRATHLALLETVCSSGLHGQFQHWQKA